MNPHPKSGATRGEGSPADPPSAPYGPHPHGVDEAAGGADSSPYETASSDEREGIAEEGREKDQRVNKGSERRPSG